MLNYISVTVEESKDIHVSMFAGRRENVTFLPISMQEDNTPFTDLFFKAYWRQRKKNIFMLVSLVSMNKQ